jgi:hypothetical protein
VINDILTAAGFVLGASYKRSRFPSPPAGTYAVYLDDVTADGPDGINCIFTHDITVELYEAEPDDAKEEAMEAALDAAGLAWSKQDRYWLQDVQRYQVIYEFTYITKRRA